MLLPQSGSSPRPFSHRPLSFGVMDIRFSPNYPDRECNRP
jgi:hypothetical protein